MLRYSLPILFSLISTNAVADLTPEQLETWFNNDKLDMPEEAAVQDEVLRFILKTKKKNIPLTEKTYRINADSLKTGWVIIEQCYHNLDPVSQLEVLYEYQEMRKLEVTHQHLVEKLWIEGQSVQMENLSKGAAVCTKAEVKILRHADTQKYLLLAGPFKRKFLDGYYPMQVKLNIHYPAKQLAFDEMFPAPAPGFNVSKTNDSISISSIFTGKLYLALSFKSFNTIK